MNTPHTNAAFTHLEASLPSTITPSMLDGYLAPSASGPTFVMPNQVLRWVSEPAAGDRSPDFKIGMPGQTINNLIVQHYQAVNDALNDQTYAPHLANPRAWCQGYLAGFAADMTAWAPLIAAQPELLKVIMSGAGAEDLADAARRIHAFWVARRRTGVDGGAFQGQATALTPGQAAQPDQRLHRPCPALASSA